MTVEALNKILPIRAAEGPAPGEGAPVEADGVGGEFDRLVRQAAAREETHGSRPRRAGRDEREQEKGDQSLPPGGNPLPAHAAAGESSGSDGGKVGNHPQADADGNLGHLDAVGSEESLLRLRTPKGSARQQGTARGVEPGRLSAGEKQDETLEGAAGRILARALAGSRDEKGVEHGKGGAANPAPETVRMSEAKAGHGSASLGEEEHARLLPAADRRSMQGSAVAGAASEAAADSVAARTETEGKVLAKALAGLQEASGKQAGLPEATPKSGVGQAERPAVQVTTLSVASSQAGNLAGDTGASDKDGDDLARALVREAGQAGQAGEVRLHGMENGDPSRMRLDGNAASQPRPEAITGREVEIRTPVGHEAWEKSMARQVLESVREGSQQVKLRLHPDTLGSIEVRVSHDDGGARIQFTTHHAVVKEAMEAAMPRLREMFHGSGMNLLEASVARHGGQQPGQGGAFGQGNGDGHAGQAPASPMPAGGGNDEGLAGERSPATAPLGAIDYYI